MRTYFLTGLFLTMATYVSAGETFDMNRTAKGVSEPQMHQNAQGHLIGNLHSTLTPEISDAAHPFFGMTGDCTGHIVIKSGSARGAGTCVYGNADGDTALLEYAIIGLTAEGGFHGTWVSHGGTDKMADLSGGGTWFNTAAAENGTYTQHVNGAIRLP
ncbi:hypothetical protein [Litoreibacter halocynthiae]|uniref:hypothetical protein n=1 Tax=Litoreibacter halocynthiae TaxID=1242689 RepID=UPI00249232C9|nr:hypothetical protein [Litoreibacter halocynthiae]